MADDNSSSYYFIEKLISDLSLNLEMFKIFDFVNVSISFYYSSMHLQGSEIRRRRLENFGKYTRLSTV